RLSLLLMIAFGSRQMAPDMTPLPLPHTSFRCWKRRSSTKHDRCLQAKPRLIYRGTLRIVAAFAAITAFSTAVDAQEPRVFDNAQPATWIAPAGVPGDSFTVFHARRTFDLTAVPARFVVHVSADNRYRL